MPASDRHYRVRMKFWPPYDEALLERVVTRSVSASQLSAFDIEMDLQLPRPSLAGAAVLDAAAGLVFAGASKEGSSGNEPGGRDGPQDPYLDALDISTLPAGRAVCLWRAQDGWIVVFVGEPQAWRTFCGTFLNGTVHRTVPAAAAWGNAAVHSIATQVLDTHRAEDAVGTCLTYGISAAVVEAWRDDAASLSKAMSERLAWAVLEETGGGGAVSMEEEK